MSVNRPNNSIYFVKIGVSNSISIKTDEPKTIMVKTRLPITFQNVNHLRFCSKKKYLNEIVYMPMPPHTSIQHFACGKPFIHN